MTRLLEFPSIEDARGRLAFLEANRHVPFSIRSASWWSGRTAGNWGPREVAHSHAVLAIAGSVDIEVEEEGAIATHRLARPDRALLLRPGTRWQVRARSEDAVGVTLESFGAGAEPRASLRADAPLPTVGDARLLDLTDPAGERGVSRVVRQPSFELERLYYLFGVPEHTARGSHAHKALEQVIVAVSGSFSLTLSDGESELEVRLDRPTVGLYVPRLMWRELREFSPGAVCLVLASRRFEESDYIHDFTEFQRYRRSAAEGAGGPVVPHRGDPPRAT